MYRMRIEPKSYYCSQTIKINFRLPNLKYMRRKTLALPDLRKENIVTSYAQIRPYREGGYRIEKQVISQKYIFHNYGHGGSGVSLSYGSAQKIVNIFQSEVTTKNNQCAVLGSGVLGLLTALQLRSRGHKVKIYTKRIPTFGQKNNKLMMTSEVAPGFWFPYDYLDNQQLNLDELAESTMNFLKDSIQKKRFRAVKYCETYDQVYLPEVIKRFQKLFSGKSSQVEVDFGNGIKQKFVGFTTVKIDMQLWLKQLLVELVRGGAEFVPREFQELKDVLGLKQKYIFNCTGYGSKYLFDDQNMKAYRGHLVEFLNPNPELYNYIFGTRVGKDVVRIYAHENRILLGLTKEETEQIEVDEGTVERLIRNYQEYHKLWTTLPLARL